ncbi:MAG: hypothetical protein WCT47_13415 [Betaproteobacteria bacterium]
MIMRALHIDLAPDSVVRALRRATAAEWLLLVVGMTLCAWAAWAWVRQDAAEAVLRAEVAQVKTRLAGRQAATIVTVAEPVPPDRSAAVSGLIAQLNVPWSSLLGSLEQADHPTVAVLELSLQPKQRVLRGAAEARDITAMLRFLQRLQSQPALEAVRLIRHEHTDQDTAQPVRFEFEGILRLDSPK